MPRAWLVVFVVVGCGPGFVKLEPARVARLDVGVAGGDTRVCLRDGATQLRAHVTYRDRSVIRMRTPLDPDGTLRATDLAWSAGVGAIDTDARLRLPELLVWHDREVPIEARVPGRTDVVQRVTLVPRFDCDDGTTRDGTAGRGDRHVEIALAYVDTRLNGRLVLVRVTELGHPAEYHLVDRRGPSAARFVVRARGAAGRDGADGVPGSTGSSGTSGMDGMSGGTCQDGGDGTNGSDGGNGGDGGDGEDGGDGGPGAEVVLWVPPEFPELASALEIDVSGGRAGRGGAGGSGGPGGSGGRGGHGGAAGSSMGTDGKSCFTTSGRDGRDGSDGRSGSSGHAGSDGHAGRSGTIVARSRAVGELFANEAVAGWKIAAPVETAARR